MLSSVFSSQLSGDLACSRRFPHIDCTLAQPLLRNSHKGVFNPLPLQHWTAAFEFKPNIKINKDRIVSFIASN